MNYSRLSMKFTLSRSHNVTGEDRTQVSLTNLRPLCLIFHGKNKHHLYITFSFQLKYQAQIAFFQPAPGAHDPTA